MNDSTCRQQPEKAHGESYSLTLPLPPSVNNLYSTFMRGKKPVRARSHSYDNWIDMAHFAANQQGVVSRAEEPTRKNTWHVQARFWVPTWRSDLDNHFKALNDWLATRFALSDNRLISIDARKTVTKEEPSEARIIVYVYG